MPADDTKLVRVHANVSGTTGRGGRARATAARNRRRRPPRRRRAGPGSHQRGAGGLWAAGAGWHTCRQGAARLRGRCDAVGRMLDAGGQRERHANVGMGRLRNCWGRACRPGQSSMRGSTAGWTPSERRAARS